jgi:uracil phosphoribosyltransferase
MVATGNTAIAALKMMKEWGLPMDRVSFLGVIASRKALEGIEKVFPDVQVGFRLLHFLAHSFLRRETFISLSKP